MKKELVLIAPQNIDLLRGFPGGLIVLYNYVKKHSKDIEVRILDYSSVRDEYLKHKISDDFNKISNNCFVGITTNTATYQSSISIAGEIKRLKKESKIILGGKHATWERRIILENHDYIDFIVRGAGEIPLLDLLNSYPILSKVPNISYLSEGKLIENSLSYIPTENEVNQYSPLISDNNFTYSSKFNKVTYMSSFGCSNNCYFCAAEHKGIVSKSIGVINKDLALMVTNNYKFISFEDNFFGNTKQRLINICKILKYYNKNKDLSWDCQTRVESCINNENIMLMDESGCKAIYLGIESFIPSTLKYLGKTNDPDLYKVNSRIAIINILDSNIRCYINLQLGIPDENQYQMSETLDHIKEIGLKAIEFNKNIIVFPQLHVIYPGTVLYSRALKSKKYGPNSKNIFEKFTKWEKNNDDLKKWLGTYFAHGAGGIPEGILDLDKLKEGMIAIDPNKIIKIINFIENMKKIPGIKVFDYLNIS